MHREDIHPLDEGVSYQRLVASGRTIEDVAAALAKSKGYVYQRISLTRLVPKVQDLLARDVLPLVYALKIAVVPAEHQEEALAQCFRPLFRDEEARRDQLEPLALLTAWVEKTVRLNPKSEDTNVLLPALVEQVALDAPSTPTLYAGPLKDVAGFAVDTVALDATKAATPSRLVLIDTAELGWQRARCRSRAHRLTPADPVLVGLNTLQQWLWQRLQIPIAATHA